jgi:hypothetical protein
MSSLSLKKEIQIIIKNSGYGKNPDIFSSIVKIITMRHQCVNLNLVKQLTYLELEN